MLLHPLLQVRHGMRLSPTATKKAPLCPVLSSLLLSLSAQPCDVLSCADLSGLALTCPVSVGPGPWHSVQSRHLRPVMSLPALGHGGRPCPVWSCAVLPFPAAAHRSQYGRKHSLDLELGISLLALRDARMPVLCFAPQGPVGSASQSLRLHRGGCRARVGAEGRPVHQGPSPHCGAG